MIIEICRRLLVFGDLRDYVYVGLGGLEFVDFELAHRTLGVQTMYSMESKELESRLNFNKPYEKIKILYGQSTEVLTDVVELDQVPSIVWLDFTDPLNKSALADISYLSSKMRAGSALFLTLNCHFGNDWSLDRVEANFGDYYDSSLTRGRYLSAGLGNEQLIALEKAIAKSIGERGDGLLSDRVLDVRYQDSSKMQVAGWIFTEASGGRAAERCRLAELDFTSPARGDKPLTLSWPELTELEWAALARQLPVASHAELRAPHDSISERTLEKFAAIYRFSRLERLYA